MLILIIYSRFHYYFWKNIQSNLFICLFFYVLLICPLYPFIFIAVACIIAEQMDLNPFIIFGRITNNNRYFAQQCLRCSGYCTSIRQQRCYISKFLILITFKLYESVLLKKSKLPFLIFEKFNITYIGTYKQSKINLIFFG